MNVTVSELGISIIPETPAEQSLQLLLLGQSQRNRKQAEDLIESKQKLINENASVQRRKNDVVWHINNVLPTLRKQLSSMKPSQRRVDLFNAVVELETATKDIPGK